MAIRTGLVLFLIALLVYIERGYCTLLLCKLILWKTRWLCSLYFVHLSYKHSLLAWIKVSFHISG